MIEQRIDHPSAWTGASIRGKEAFAFDLGPRHLDAFKRAIESVRARGLGLDDVARRDFPLDAIAEDLASVKHALDDGHGIVVVRGFPVGQWTPEDVELMYWGLGCHLGTAASQSVMGDRLGHVTDVSDIDPNARAYRSRRELSLHNDFGNYHGMLSLSVALRGGESRFASSLAVHNAMLAEAPHHLPRLYRGWPLYRLGEEAEGELPHTPHRVPVYSVCEGWLSCRYMRGFIEAGATLRGHSLEEPDVAALDCLDTIAHRDEVMVEFLLDPGEAAFYNNLVVMHARAAFENGPSPDTRRHLLRLWLYADDARPVVPEIEVFDSPGIPPQPGRSPSGEGELLTKLGATGFSKAGLGSNPNA